MKVYVYLIMLLVLGTICGPKLPRNDHFRKRLLIVALALLAIISGARYGIGGDYAHYVNEFNAIRKYGASKAYTEAGYTFFSLSLAKLHLPVQFLFILSSALLYVALYYFISRNFESRYWLLCVLLFVILGFFFSSMNLMRQYMAASFCIIAFDTYLRRKYLQSTFWWILAILFHSVAVFAVLIPLVARLCKSRYAFTLISGIFILTIVLSFIDIRPSIAQFLHFFPRWSGYASSEFFIDRNRSAILKNVVPDLLFAWYLLKNIKDADIHIYLRSKSAKSVQVLDDSIHPFFVSGALLYIGFQNIFYGVMVATRISEIFFIVYLGFLVELQKLCETEFSRKLYITGLILYGVVLTVITIFIGKGNGVVPYTSIVI